MDGWTEMVLAFERRIRRPLDAGYLLPFVIASHLTANLDSELHVTKDSTMIFKTSSTKFNSRNPQIHEAEEN